MKDSARSRAIFVGPIWHEKEKFILRARFSSLPRVKSRPTRASRPKLGFSFLYFCYFSLSLSLSLSFILALFLFWSERAVAEHPSHSLFSWLPLTRGKLLGNAITFATTPPPSSSLPPWSRHHFSPTMSSPILPLA